MVDSVGGTHHVKIGGQYFLVRPGSYRKRPAPIFGPRFTTGDTDYSTLSFWQHWVQSCWVGGFGANEWIDDAMFHEGVGIDASQHEVMLLSRDLGPQTDRGVTGNWDLNSETKTREFTVFNSKLYCLQRGGSVLGTSRLYRFDDATVTWILVKSFAEQVDSFVSFGGYLVFADAGTTQNRMDSSEVFTTFAKPAGITSWGNIAIVYRSHCYFGFGRVLYRLKSDFTWDGSTAFYTAEGINFFNHVELHLGQLYFASNNGHILRTDGNNTYDLWAFEPHVQITGMRSFDGRLFFGCREDLVGTNSAEGVIYHMSGSSVTELKRWGRVGYDVVPGKLRAFGSSLYFGAGMLLGFGSVAGFGIARYDPVEDGYHLLATNMDGGTFPAGSEGINMRVDDIMFWKGYVYCSVYGYGIFRTKISYKDAHRALATYDTTPAGGAIGGLNGGWFSSSDFDAGTPGLLKLWNTMTITADLPNTACSVYAEISSDGGATWFPAGGTVATASVIKTGTATRYSKRILLQDSGASGGGWYATRMKYRLTLRTTNTLYSPQLRSVVLRYLPVPEPNWIWDMTLVLSDQQELLDGNTDVPNNPAKLAVLETAFRNQSLVNFVDIDGISWASGGLSGALIMSMESNVPFIGPGSAGPLEREVRIQLLEAIEAYEV